MVKGNPFQKATKITAAIAVAGSASQPNPWSITPSRIRNELISPNCGSYMNRQRIAATTPGITHGKSTSDRSTPCIGSRWFSSSAIRNPPTFCSSTTPAVQITELRNTCQKTGSPSISR